MFRQSAIFFLLAGLIFCAPAASAETGQEIPYPDQQCVVYVPKEVITGKKAPVLVCLPGRGVGAKEDIRKWREASKFVDLFLVDFDVDYLSIEDDQGIRRLQFRIESTLKQMSQSYSVDTQKVCLVGTSAGAVAALALVLRYPARYESAGLVSTGPVNFETEDYAANASGKPFYITHGEQDQTVPFEEAVKVKDFLDRSHAVVQFVSVPGGRHGLPPGVYRAVVRWLFPPKDFFQKLKSFF